MRIRHVGVQGPGKPTAGERMGTTERNKRLPTSASLEGARGCIALAKMQIAKKNWYLLRSNLHYFSVAACADGTVVAAGSKHYYTTWMDARFSHNIYNSMSYSHDRNIANIEIGLQLCVTKDREHNRTTHSSS